MSGPELAGDKLRIAILCYPTFGGSGVLATELAMSLADRGHRVHLLSYAPPTRLRRYQRNLCFHLVQVSSYPLFRYPSYDLALAAKILEIEESEPLDLVHAHYAIPHTISAILASKVNVARPLKVVTTLHGTDITLVGSERSYVPLIRWALNESDAVTAVSRYLAAETRTTFCSSCNLKVIHNFYDPAEFRPLPSERPRLAPPTLVHVSNFRPVKRTPDLIHVLYRVRRELDARLLLVGDGPDRARVQELAAHFGLSEHVSFLGEQTDIAGILADADVFLLPSETESFGLSALEAMACGLPVVATNVGGVPEIVEHGKSGVLCPLGDLDALAEGVLRIAGDRAAWERYSAAAAAGALPYAKDVIVSRYEALYEETLGRGPR
jgi:N-acetyl-alpha-D-glucosaminyl L-malate synthase BshA